MFWQHGPNGLHAPIVNVVRNLPRLLAAAEVLGVWRRRIELDTALPDEVPAVLQVLSRASQLEVVHVDGQHQAEFVVTPYAFPAWDRPEADAARRSGGGGGRR